MNTKVSCHFCGGTLKGRVEATWEGKGGGQLVDDCGVCGVYQLPLDLLPVVDGLTDAARVEIAEYLQALAQLEDATPMRFTPGFFGI